MSAPTVQPIPGIKVKPSMQAIAPGQVIVSYQVGRGRVRRTFVEEFAFNVFLPPLPLPRNLAALQVVDPELGEC